MWTHIQVLASALRRRILQIEGQLLTELRLMLLQKPAGHPKKSWVLGKGRMSTHTSHS
jgi:hypothetical protein